MKYKYLNILKANEEILRLESILASHNINPETGKTISPKNTDVLLAQNAVGNKSLPPVGYKTKNKFMISQLS